MEIAPIFVSVEEAAEKLNLGKYEVYRLCKSGEIKAQRRGTRILIPVQALHEFAESLPSASSRPA